MWFIDKLLRGPKKVKIRHLKRFYTGQEGLLSINERKRIHKHLKKHLKRKKG